MARVREKADNACNALEYRKTEIIVKICTLPEAEQKTNKSGKFSESISLE